MSITKQLMGPIDLHSIFIYFFVQKEIHSGLEQLEGEKMTANLKENQKLKFCHYIGLATFTSVI